MYDYRRELERRIAQFSGYLKPMNERVHEIAHSACMVIFEEQRPHGVSDDALVEKRENALKAVRSAFDEFASNAAGFGDSESNDLPDEGWRGDDSLKRFIQFSFENKLFCLDMPRQTLFRPEAQEILRYRKGFFYLSRRKQFTLYGEDVDGYDPFRKVYVYGDESSAAQDMAFIFFQVWKFPVDSQLYVSSGAFNGKHKWDQGVPIE